MVGIAFTARRARLTLRLGSRFRKMRESIGEMRRRARSRRELLTLADNDWRDIGISRSEALAEARKPFWRA
ncbi:MAG TPA: DUF1127 domain-containing protein [Stellaceae bacterium]|jgi:uncharacterized protein YjiS (DUF1127 family)|nr:DUF1127 domain-containing protein [Stellaceae bacterium]